VSDITAADESNDDQKIIVEVTDPWTMDLVNKIIAAKQVDGKCHIVPVKVNEVLGQILSQFCLMPELNAVYSELLSNRGARFYAMKHEDTDEVSFVKRYFESHNQAVPITVIEAQGRPYAIYAADHLADIAKRTHVSSSDCRVALNSRYWMERKNVVILGHNSKSRHIMAGFRSFCNEWNRNGEEIVQIVVVDDAKNLEKMNYYRDYPFVIETVEANVYDKDVICDTIDRVVSRNKGDTSVLILSDDSVLNEDIDASALANLICVQDIVAKKQAENPAFDTESIDVIVEIIDPKHHDVVNSYNVNNVVISNRYISKMVTQISEYEALFDFYSDILSYDEEGATEYESKELYLKKVSRYFDEIPAETTADRLVRAVYEASLDEERMGTVNPTILLGYVKPGGTRVLFSGDLTQIPVKLEARDKVILFSAH